ncbi:MAG: MoxR family ATPase [Thaumarchaeota archaeon]|nr:MoxR family ATPase [Nitrososphaerota archaeon]|tara:strand:- start:274 stop:1248 length:975 start_codon:yes stop_codon:yes gene_type:complete
MMADNINSLSDITKISEDIRSEVNKSIVGLTNHIDTLTLSLLTGGHVLLEGLPGTAKTFLAVSFSNTLSLENKRIQSTPDMMPGDVTGTRIYNPKTLEFDFHAGPIFANVVIVDEINRAPPRTQAAFLEAMQEGQVTVDGETSMLDQPFMVLATKNPLEYEGTFPLSPTQLDRFMFRINLGYPTLDEEVEILRNKTKSSDSSGQIISKDQILQARKFLIDNMSIDDGISDYISSIVQSTRTKEGVIIGASPTASVSLLNASRGHAAIIRGSDKVTTEDVNAVAFDVLNHRLLIKQSDIADSGTDAESSNSAEKIITDIIQSGGN